MLVDSGITWAITGHSERRCGFGFPGESDEVVGRKTKVAIDAGMSVIACIGEKVKRLLRQSFVFFAGSTYLYKRNIHGFSLRRERRDK